MVLIKKKNHKKILFIVNNLYSGGCETQIFNLIEGLLLTQQYNISLLNLGDKEESFISEKSELIKRIELIEFHEFTKSKNKLEFIISYIKLWSLLKKSKFDILIPFHRNTSIIFSLLSFFLKPKSFFQERGGEINTLSRPNPLIIGLAKLSHPIYVANSHCAKGILSDKYAINKDKINVIYNGIKLNKTRPIKINNFKERDEIIITKIANFYPEKNHEIVIKAIQKLVNYYGIRNIKLLLVGNDNKNGLMIKTEQLIIDLDLTNYVQIIEHVYNVSDILNQTDIALISSFSEGLSNTLIEYISHELPIVASEIPSIKEILGANFNYYFNNYDFNSLTEKLILLINDPLRSNKGKELNLLHLNKFDLNKFVNNYKALIDANTK